MDNNFVIHEGIAVWLNAFQSSCIGIWITEVQYTDRGFVLMINNIITVSALLSACKLLTVQQKIRMIY